MTDAMFRPSVSVILLTWNQRDLTLDCLASLRQLDYPAEKLNVIVVDNGSRDDTVAAIRECFPEVTVLENGDNLGFAEGNNVGIRHALRGTADCIMLLNNDTEVDPHMLLHLTEALYRHDDIGVVGPKMLYFDPPDVIWCAGNSINWWTGATARLQAEQKDSAQVESEREVDFITACAVLLRREVIEQIGLLDARFFIYYEETDWLVRASRAGWRILYVPQARMWHKVSAAMGTTSPATDYYFNRNRLLFLARHQHGLRKWISLALAAGRNLLAVAAYTAKPHGGTRRRNRDVRLLALRDAWHDRTGKMPDDAAAICYGKPRT